MNECITPLLAAFLVICWSVTGICIFYLILLKWGDEIFSAVDWCREKLAEAFRPLVFWQ